MKDDSNKKVGRVPVKEAAKIMEMDPQSLRIALKQGLFPFGMAIKTSANNYIYFINRHKFEEYMGLNKSEGKENENDKA